MRAGCTFLAIVMAGCAPAPAPPASASPQSEVQVRLADEKDLAALVAQQKGKVVLIDCWATWCDPCKEQFPHTVALHRKLAGRGLVVVSLSMDKPAERESVLAFLRQQQAAFPNLLSRHGASEEGFNVFDIQNGALPYYVLYDRHGKRRDDLGTGDKTEGLKPEELDKAVEKLLAE